MTRVLFILGALLCAVAGANAADMQDFYYGADPEKTAAYYVLKTAENPSNRANYYSLASVFKEFGENQKAIEAYLEILKLNPKEVRAHFELAKMYYYTGDAAKGEEMVNVLESKNMANWEVLYWHGCMLLETGRYEEAKIRFLQAIDENMYRNISYIKMAEAYEKTGDIDKALEYYKEAINKDKTYTELNRRIAVLHEKKQEFISAYKYWNKVVEVDTQDTEAREKAQKFAQFVPAIKQMIENDKKRKTDGRAAYTPPEKIRIKESAGFQQVKAGIITGARQVHFKHGSDFAVINHKGEELFKGAAVTDYELTAEKKGIFISDSEGNSRTLIGENSVIKPANENATAAFYNIAYGQGFYWAERADTTYRGDFVIVEKSGKINVINSLNMEEYLYGVIAAEIPPDWPEEALKAQAVSARTYTMKHLNSHKKDGYDVCATQHCAVYKGVSGENARTIAAVDATRGEVLYDAEGKLLSTFFSNCCGGHTEDVFEVWGYKESKSLKGVYDGDFNWKWKFPLAPFDLEEYVRSMPDVYCKAEGAAETSFRWIRYLDAQDLQRYVAKRKDIGRIKKVEPLKRARGGAVTRIRITGEKGVYEVKFDPIRSVMGKIRSNVIKWEYASDSEGFIKFIYIYGAGWGHSVGMCQRGLKGMSEKGKKYKEILRHYYSDSQIKKLYGD
ncbi:MAG TPA: SpoIID/LytB domain-containing protein [Candidatus Goldiibacteriota bacterium]|nr:SpoIID/LytB domain-containing protein [Candidatus Goldiibacteriota bacterium]